MCTHLLVQDEVEGVQQHQVPPKLVQHLTAEQGRADVS